ncbi:hypothetical protein [Arthrobacter rhizosphaerae]|uniref:hypothetical protein n=1 Tax=Arthrobacter rhizosphaerae TaxID=2855490 RepID=UPI001FF12087|nr:hypothetical protein [Arthrobacter rhizosphaerae]
MKNLSVLSIAAAAAVALSSCTGGGGSGTTSPGSPTPTEAQSKVYSEEELRDLVSGVKDDDGNELRLYSPDQVDQGERIARLLMGTATVNPGGCRSIATAGLLESVENGEVAVAISESEEPRTLSAQSGPDGADAESLVRDIRGKMGECAQFTVDVAGQRLDVKSEELQAETDADETFATLSTRGEGTSDMLMQVSAGKDRLLVVATKSGAALGDDDQKELEKLINEVLDKADDASSPTTTSSPTSTASVSPSPTGTGPGNTSEPSPSGTELEEATEGPTSTATGGAGGSS